VELAQAAQQRSASISLKTAVSGSQLSVIAEIKRASPSRGRFPVEFEPDAVATEYIGGGASAISVLTDGPFFQGSLLDLEEVAGIGRPAGVPVLRKDFIVDEFQILEAKAHGADAILLIVAALDQFALLEFQTAARELGMDSLVEVHNEEEMERAVAAGTDLIGINNRDLHTFNVDLAVTERLAPLAPPEATLVGESGIFVRADANRLASVGVSAILVGESLIVSNDRAAAVRRLSGGNVAKRNG
jgi:indole-3-glycerol phosphate synthase